MKALVYVGKNQVELKEVANPIQQEGQMNLKVIYCGICGSDIGIFGGTHPRAKAPLVLGHEFIGEALADSSDGKIHKGDRVAAYPLLTCGHCRSCRTGNEHVCSTLGMIGIDRDGGTAEYVTVQETMLVRLPDGLSDKAAALIEPLAVVIRALHQSGIRALDSAAVIGAGAIGVLTGIMLKKMGIQNVLISDIDPYRLKQAESFGLEPVVAQDDKFLQRVKELTDGEGVDVLFECSGAPSAALEMTKLTRIGGIICMTAVHKTPHAVDLRDINFREQLIVGTRVYTKEEFTLAVKYAQVIQPELERLVTHILPLSDSARVFDLIAEPANHVTKVLIDCKK